MKRALFLVIPLLLSSAAVRAQDVTLPSNIERLADRATDVVNVTVDGALLQLAAKFLSASDPDQAIAKKLISDLEGIYVRSFEFARPGEYSNADVDSLRSQVKGPQWSRMASVRSQKSGQDVDVFLKLNNDEIAGVVVIAAEPTRLTWVNIVGPIDIDQLARLSGQFGIPKLDVSNVKK